MFAVIYRWKVKAGQEDAFRQAWRSLTEVMRARYGTAGSRLHRTQEGEFLAYAVWPNRDAWSNARAQPSVHPEAGATMRDSIEQSFPPTTLDVVDDLLGVLPA